MSNNIVKFEDKEYVWEEISGKGKCLVPFKEVNPFLGIIVGSKLIFDNGYEFRIVLIGDMYTMIYIPGYKTDCNYNVSSSNLGELENKLFDCAKKLSQVLLWKKA